MSRKMICPKCGREAVSSSPTASFSGISQIFSSPIDRDGNFMPDNLESLLSNPKVYCYWCECECEEERLPEPKPQPKPEAKPEPKPEPKPESSANVTYKAILVSHNGNKMAVTNILMKAVGLSMSEANALLNSLPQVIGEEMSYNSAESCRDVLQSAGATVKIKAEKSQDDCPNDNAGPEVPAEGFTIEYADGTLWIAGNGKFQAFLKANKKLRKEVIDAHKSDIKAVRFKGHVENLFGGIFSLAFSFMFFPNLEEVTLAEGIDELPSSAFSSCKKLRKLVLPDSLRKISYTAFNDCDSLAEVVNLRPEVDYGKAFTLTPLKDKFPAK